MKQIQKSKRLVIDIETAMNLGGYFGPTYDVNIAKVIQKGFVLGFAYKWLYKPKIYSCYIWDFPLYKKDPRNDLMVIKKWIEVMQDSELIIGQNSDQFDNKVMYGRLLVHGLPPLAMPQSADTKKMVKRIARYDSNKLDDLGEQFGYGKKIKTDIDLWWDCMMGIKKAQKEMVTYNKRDVALTEKVYLHLLPHALNHPNMATLLGRPDVCVHCGENKGFVLNGFHHTRTSRKQRYRCNACFGNNTARQAIKEEKPLYA
jgi:DNA polymerase elongation subunit (family B)